MNSLRSRSPLLALLVIHSLAGLAAGQPVTSRTFTLDADFDQGDLLNVNHSSPQNHQLQLSGGLTPFPYVAVSETWAGALVRVDANTGAIVGYYWTAPAGMGRYPSATAVDRLGNVWVHNQKEYSVLNGVRKGSFTRIGLVMGGTRTDAVGNPDPNGSYLKPPFRYNTCVDRNNDGLIKTSRGWGGYYSGAPPDFLPWTNAGGTDTAGGVSTADDECIINYVRTYGYGNDAHSGAIAVDQNNDVWVGAWSGWPNPLGTPGFPAGHEKLSGVTGQPIPETQFDIGAAGVGAAIDRLNRLWVWGPLRLLNLNPAPPPAYLGQPQILSVAPDGALIEVDPITGRLFLTSSGWDIIEIDHNLTVLGQRPAFWFLNGMVFDGRGDLWVSAGGDIGHYRRNPSQPTVLDEVWRQTMSPFYGVGWIGVDANGKIWYGDATYEPVGGTFTRLNRLDPVTHTVDLRVPQQSQVSNTWGDVTGVKAGGYRAMHTWGDVTGVKAGGYRAMRGLWSVVHDSLQAATEWGRLWWNAATPPGTSLLVQMRAAEHPAQLTKKAFTPVANGGTACGAGVLGRYIEISVDFSKEYSATGDPVLYDLTLNGCTPPQADLALAMTDSPDPVSAGANLTYTLSVVNQGPAAATGVTVTDTLPAGVSLVSATATQGACTGSSTISCSLGSLASGATATVTLLVRPAAAGAIVNTAAVGAGEPDPNPSNNSATATTTVTTVKEITALSPARLWVGLKNSDDQGTQFDLRAELYRNGALIASGVTLCVTGVTRNPSLAIEAVVPFGALTSGALEIGDQLALKVLTRIGTNPDGTRCSGHASATGLRLYYDAVARASRFGAAIAPDPLKDYFFHGNASLRYLDPIAPTGTTAKSIDSAGVKYAGGNPWVEVGAWSMTVP